MIKLQLKIRFVFYNWFINSEDSFETEALNGWKIRKLNETNLEGEVRL